MNTATFVKETRKILGLTQQQLSEKIQKDRVNISLYETGKNIPPGDVVLKLMTLRFPDLCMSGLHPKTETTENATPNNNNDLAA